MTYIRNLPFAVLAAAVTIFPLSATQVFMTPPGSSTGGGPVNAMVSFAAGAGTLTVTLVDLQANPTSVAQLLSDLEFTVSLLGTTSLSSSSANFVTVNSNGSTSSAGSGSTGWVLNSLGGSNYTLCDVGCVGAAGPKHLIIGPGPYTNANGSIAGNGPHNPFIDQTATFTISNSNITQNTTVSNIMFSFGTTAGIFVNGDPGTIPEPATTGFVGLGTLLSLLGVRAKRKG